MTAYIAGLAQDHENSLFFIKNHFYSDLKLRDQIHIL